MGKEGKGMGENEGILRIVREGEPDPENRTVPDIQPTSPPVEGPDNRPAGPAPAPAPAVGGA
ncbi:MAG: hypothetical protein KJN92_05945, partial [Gemmatimonadetes bacterium]|nr:hypothetical protein [Gemmatimonadota bacterium]